ncbi:MAG: HAMP domain-containing sensor histidine kinase [Advenella sp.]|uniref:sensor histidine kinase n=1 Tax=Advenella mandrilli TaxID=2800330 RepID=UPI001F39A573|nr:HAMP domain-containing sensor histidine kinase [Advenella mandrilli]MDY0270934.1 HAMP domain-containing sensor histidine kinase [Advenella sp.]
MKSISRRIHRAILLVSMACIAVMVVMVLEVNEDLERTMLQVEFEQELDFILQNRDDSELFVWEGFNQQLVFVPQGLATPAQMPEVFKGLPLGFSDEIKQGKNTYLVNIAVLPKGVVYIAKDITHFEDREFLFSIALGVMTLVIIGLGLWMATLSSRRIVDPLQQLSEQISEVPVGSQMPRIPVNYTDSELHSIAVTFNRFLGELESYVRREQSLLSLASHELRTPVAVMSGALDILEMRGQLKPNDLATVARMRNACTEMRSNVEVLLKLSRNQSDVSPVTEVISLTALVEEVLDDLNNLFRVQTRVRLTVIDKSMLRTDSVLVKMLLRNLIQNALQHTQKEIDITLGKGLIQIKDRGTGFSAGQKAILSKEMEVMPGSSSLNGLGLYIVTLMSERLQWPLQVTQSDSSGTVIQLSIPADQML